MFRRSVCRVTATLLVASSTLFLAPPCGCATPSSAATAAIAAEPGLLGLLWAIGKEVWIVIDSEPRAGDDPQADPAIKDEEPPAEPATTDMSPHADPNG